MKPLQNEGHYPLEGVSQGISSNRFPGQGSEVLACLRPGLGGLYTQAAHSLRASIQIYQ